MLRYMVAILSGLLPDHAIAEDLHVIHSRLPQVSDDDWHAIESSYTSRLNKEPASCPICQERIGIDLQVLTSCGHSFHKVCLLAIENFTNRRTCPMCRSDEYLLKQVNCEWYAARRRAALAIQSLWRGYCVRKRWAGALLSCFRSNPVLQKRYLSQDLVRVSAGVTKAVAHRVAAVDEFLLSLEADQRTRDAFNQKINSMIAQRLSDSVEWEHVMQAVHKRDHTECPICLQEEGNKQLVLLRCAHVFHAQCFGIFQTFHSSTEQPLCPVCRDTLVVYPHPFSFSTLLESKTENMSTSMTVSKT